MYQIIQLSVHPFEYPIAFEITGIKVVGTSRNRDNRAIVNDIEVTASFHEVLCMLKDI